MQDVLHEYLLLLLLVEAIYLFVLWRLCTCCLSTFPEILFRQCIRYMRRYRNILQNRCSPFSFPCELAPCSQKKACTAHLADYWVHLEGHIYAFAAIHQATGTVSAAFGWHILSGLALLLIVLNATATWIAFATTCKSFTGACATKQPATQC